MEKEEVIGKRFTSGSSIYHIEDHPHEDKLTIKWYKGESDHVHGGETSLYLYTLISEIKNGHWRIIEDNTESSYSIF